MSGATRQLNFCLPTPTRCCVLVPTYPEAEGDRCEFVSYSAPKSEPHW
ncbi:MAG: hypothetical protein ACK559_19430 [bacterium]